MNCQRNNDNERRHNIGIHIAVIEPGRDPYLKELEPEGRESSYLGAFQREVGGNVEAYGVLWDDEPLIYVNEESLFNGSTANRAIYANDHMEEERYLSQMDYTSVVKRGDLYGLTFGTFIAVSYDPETDKPRDMPIEEWLKVCEAFAGVQSILSGGVEVTKLQAARCTEYIKVNLPGSKEGYKTGNGEGVWVLVSKQVKAAYDQDAAGGYYFGIIDNDSCYWPGLDHGAAIPFEMRGKNRPVVPYEWLADRQVKSSRTRRG